MLKNIVLDIGGVLVDYHTVDYYTARGYSQDMAQRLAQATMFCPYWEQFDIGLMPESWIREKMKQAAPELAQDIDRNLICQRGIVTRREESKDWIEHFRDEEFRVLVLSNFSQNALLNCPEAMDFLGQNLGGSGVPGTYGVVGEGIISSRDHVAKPYPEIYALLLSRYDLRPEETVFIDDTQMNLDGAKRFGMHTILFSSRAQAQEEVDGLDIRLG